MRANLDWSARLGYDAIRLAAVNRRAVEYVRALASDGADGRVEHVINGVVGPPGGGYVVGEAMSASEAAACHGPASPSVGEAGAAMMTAVTMTYVDEAIGITRAAGSNADLDVHDGLPPEVVEELVDVIFDGLPPNARRIAERASVLRRVTEPLLAAVLSDNASRGTCAHPASTRAQMRSPTKSSASHCWTSTRRDPAGNRSHGDVEPARGARHWRPAGSPTGARRASRGRPPTPPS